MPLTDCPHAVYLCKVTRTFCTLGAGDNPASAPSETKTTPAAPIESPHGSTTSVKAVPNYKDLETGNGFIQ